MNDDLKHWLDANKILFVPVDNEVIDIPGLGKAYVDPLPTVSSIFKGEPDQLRFNLMEDPETLLEEGIYYVVFPFGQNWYYFDLREEFKFNILKYVGTRTPSRKPVPYVNLGVHTPYELLNAAGDISLWVRKAKFLGHPAIGICDRNTLAGTLNLQKACARAGIKQVFGYSFTLDHLDEQVDMKIYCQTQEGLKNLLQIQRRIMVDSEEKVLDLASLLHYGKGNVLVLGTLSSFWMEKNLHVVEAFERAFEGVYYQVDLSEYKAERIDVEYLNAIKHFFHHFHLPEMNTFIIEPILISDAYYPDKDDAKSKVILNKIASGAAHQQSDDQYFKDVDEQYSLFLSLFDGDRWDLDALFERMCSHTVKIAEGANVSYAIGRMYMPEYIMRDKEIERYGNRRQMFHSLLNQGLTSKVPPEKYEEYWKRSCEEVYIIESTNNVDYFLVQWDMVNEAKRRGIMTGVGRGSAGGSLVSYLLGITTIDPIKYDLLFSRFLVPERCGLQWHNEVTVLGNDYPVKVGEEVVEIHFESGNILLCSSSELKLVTETGSIIVKAKDLKPGDDVLFDHRDELWNINGLLK